MSSVRPTLRCLRDDLSLPLPPIAIDDQILFKVKVQRWRGAAWLEPTLSWLVAAGRRESGSVDDFYAACSDAGPKCRD